MKRIAVLDFVGYGRVEPMVATFLTRERFDAFELDQEVSNDVRSQADITVKCIEKRVENEGRRQEVFELQYREGERSVTIPMAGIDGFLHLVAKEMAEASGDWPHIKSELQDIKGNTQNNSVNWFVYQLSAGILGWQVKCSVENALHRYDQTFNPIKLSQDGRRIGELETDSGDPWSAYRWTRAAAVAAFTTLLANNPEVNSIDDLKLFDFMQTESGQLFTGMETMLVLGLKHRNQFRRWEH